MRINNNTCNVLYVCLKHVHVPRNSNSNSNSNQNGVRYLYLNLCAYPEWLQLPDDDDTLHEHYTCKNVEDMYEAIINACKSKPHIVIDGAILSLAQTQTQRPFSFAAVQALLTKLMLSELTGPILLNNVNPGLFTKWQCLSIMEMSDANIIVEGGEMTLIRKARARHGANVKVIKNKQPFYVVLEEDPDDDVMTVIIDVVVIVGGGDFFVDDLVSGDYLLVSAVFVSMTS